MSFRVRKSLKTSLIVCIVLPLKLANAAELPLPVFTQLPVPKLKNENKTFIAVPTLKVMINQVPYQGEFDVLQDNSGNLLVKKSDLEKWQIDHCNVPVFYQNETYYFLSSCRDVEFQNDLIQHQLKIVTHPIFYAPKILTSAANLYSLQPSNNEISPPPVAAVVPTEEALPPKAEYEELLLSVKLNHEDTQQIVSFLQTRDNEIWVGEQDLKTWRIQNLPNNFITYNQQKYYRLHDIGGASYKVDLANAAIEIILPPEILQTTNIGQISGSLVNPPKPPLGSFLNYDLNSQSEAGSTTATAGLFQPTLFSSKGVGESGILVDNAAGSTQTTRLNTNWTVDNPDKMASFVAGDSFSAAGSWENSVGFGGLQYATNFGTQPGYITFPLPSTTGQAVLPTAVDMYINNALVQQQKLPAGPFTINNIPAVTGMGNVTVVTTDLLGRQQTVTIPYYATAELLKPGLHDFSYETGFVREDFGTESNKYSHFLADGTDLVGITNNFTAGWHTELMSNQETAGLTGNYLVNKLGVFNASVAGSYNHSQTGGLFLVGFQRQVYSGFSVGANTQVTSPRFTQLGLEEGESDPSLQSQFFVGAPITFTKGSLGLSFTRQNNRGAENVSLVGGNYTQPFGKLFVLNVNAITNIGGIYSKSIFFTLSRTIGKQTSASINGLVQTDNNQGGININRSLPMGPGWGYDLTANEGQVNNYQAQGSFQTNSGTYSAEAANQQGISGTQLNASGSVIFMDGHPFLSRQIINSFGLVQVPNYPNVDVYADNQIINKTDSHGYALIPDLRPYQDNMIAIDPNQLPLDTTIGSAQVNAIPYNNSGVFIKFPIGASYAGMLKVVQPSGALIPVGALVTVEGQKEEFVVANDGMTYVTGLKSENTVKVSWEDQECSFKLSYTPTKDPLPDLGTHICQGVKHVEPSVASTEGNQ